MTNAILRRTRNAPFLLIAPLAILACFFAGPDGATHVTADQADPELSFEQLVNDKLNLKACEVVTLDIDLTPGIERSIVVTIEGEDYTLNLAPHSVRAESYQVLMEYHDGELVEFEPLPVRTVRGSVAELPDSIIAGSVLDDGLHVVIKLDEENTYWIEPLGGRVAGAVEGEYAVYHADDVIPSGGTCGNDAADVLDHTDADDSDAGTRQASSHGTCGVAELGCDADEEYLNAHGGSVAGVQARINFVINTVNMQYESEVGITHLITAILIHTNPPGTLPGSGTEGENTYPYTSTASNTLLNQFRNHWLSAHGSIQRDVAHLFTGKNLNGSTIGEAFCIGCICSSSAFCHAQSDCCGSNACSTDLTAHELGHLWNGIHCSCPCCTMNTPLVCQNHFSALNIGRITNHRNGAHCLSCPESDTTPLPFFDDFPTTTINPDLWTGSEGTPVINGNGNDEPSPPFSLNLDFLDALRSAVMDTSGGGNLAVSYWYQAGWGNGAAPDLGDDLFVEYFNAAENWIVLNTHLGEGPPTPPNLPFQFVQIPLPGAAQHSQFRLRFRADNSAPQDEWFIDDVFVGLLPEDGTTTLPFIDEFPSTIINPELWIGVDGASIDDQGAGEPSAPLSLNVDGIDEIRSANMDTTGGVGLTLNYSWQQTGDGGNSPEANDTLFVEYLNDLAAWVEINSHPGGGPDAAPYEPVSLPLPADALHGSFRFRFRSVGTVGGQPAGFDDWFVDDVCLGTAGECQGGQPCNLPQDCDDGVLCTTDDCLSNFCVNTPVNADCDDGIACTADVCLPGMGCENTPDDAACDDGNGCTLDSCNAGSGCVNAPDVGQPCDDGLECTINDVCNADGQCTGDDNGCPVLEVEQANLPICQDTNQDDIDVPLDVCNVYARLISIDDRLISVGDTDISTTDPNGFFQHPFGNGNISPSCVFLPVLPTLVCDSFVTIGVTCFDAADSTTIDPDFDSCAFNCDSTSAGCVDNVLCGEVHGGWFNANPDGAQSVPDADQRVLIARFSVAQGHTVSGTLTAFARIGLEEPPLIVGFLGLEFICAGGTVGCNEACPTDVDNSGDTGAPDLAVLLGSWGPCEPGAACECLDTDEDGLIGAADLAALLGSWGSCT